MATRDGHYKAWGVDVLVNASSPKLAVALPLLEVPPNAIVFFLGRLGWVLGRGPQPRD